MNNILNIQAVSLAVCKEAAQVSLSAGANDSEFIMIGEAVFSAAGVPFKLSAYDMQRTNVQAGFEPHLRTQKHTLIDLPPCH